jgi:hypothetical protein
MAKLDNYLILFAIEQPPPSMYKHRDTRQRSYNCPQFQLKKTFDKGLAKSGQEEMTSSQCPRIFWSTLVYLFMATPNSDHLLPKWHPPISPAFLATP